MASTDRAAQVGAPAGPVAQTAARLHALLAPEHRLLFGSAVPGFTAPAPLLAAITSAGWGSLRYTAEREKAVIALARVLAGAEHGSVPAEAAPLRQLAMVMEFRMHYLRQRLGQSVRALHEAGIPVLLLKGAAVAAWYHRRFAARPMLDLDLLVPPDQARRAYDVLCTAGWAVPAAEDTVQLPAGGIHHLPALHDASGVEVNLEVHTDVIPPGHPFAFGAADVWREARPVGDALGADLAGVFVPSARHMALHACIHLAWQHMLRTGTWRTAGDLRVITADPTFNWAAFVTLAQEARAASSGYWALRLVEGLAAVPVPAPVLAALEPLPPAGVPRAVMRAAHTLVERHLLAVLIPGGPDCPSVRLRRLAWECAIRPHDSGHQLSRPWHVEEHVDAPAHQALSQSATLQRGRASAGPPRFPAGVRWREFVRYARAVLGSSRFAAS
ncbi:nucleotidyltransferase family protein [Gemmatimonas sp.]|uniref:nucleotidyltransferase family protein n=2 Tax=Gemmatimonas sp. TaxID=1962908 RepID=UPI0025BF868E|nr:nucleotidyltransferase family protein [Gemmatimonas sp.]MCE2955380.1 nucleotidyltransferase family protein [Gemmatimonas sp.]